MVLNSKKDARIPQLHPRLFVATVKMEPVKSSPMNVKPASRIEKSNYSLDRNANGLPKSARKKNNASMVPVSAFSTKKTSKT